MLFINNQPTGLFPAFLLSKKEHDVDKRTTRKTPGQTGDTRPPKSDEFNEIERKNNLKNDVQEETVDNEERDKNSK
ncbi:hypothetical protein [Algoriphagus yeomjeoni]|uniref:Uncharacterized protein n=1 Tax=Algoriphagus yeomjeoni TaxID=291403 RepID=A0A327PLG4_9BACT|nr:hypothetical protein [Algoriphagus yeomjeoni]RAI92171.1 hypothetical protein LV83_01400 [Algoriphagus yeomjeoni]